MHNIELKITNKTDHEYPSILLRKFFCMVFFDDTGKRLDIFIATVFGGLLEKKNDFSNQIPCAKRASSNKDCKLEFAFSASNNLIENCESKDFTKSLWEQSEWLKNIWSGCEKLDTTQKISNKLTLLYGKFDSQFSPTTGWDYLYISEMEKDHEKKSHCCVVSHGSFEPAGNNKYQISTNDSVSDGIESITWIKTTVDLNDRIISDKINLKINFSGDFYAPDFTWYFAPPINHIIPEDDFSFSLNQDKEKYNVIQRVSRNTTVKFKEWVEKPFEITRRKKFRLTELKEVLKSNVWALSENATIQLGFYIERDSSFRSSRQFIYGLVLAFVLSFCTDKTRMDGFFLIFSENKICKILFLLFSLTSPVSAIFPFVSLVLLPRRNIPPSEKFSIGLYRAVFIFSLIGIMSILFCFSIPTFLECANNFFLIIPLVLSIVSISLNLIYICHCKKHLGMRILDEL